MAHGSRGEKAEAVGQGVFDRAEPVHDELFEYGSGEEGDESAAGGYFGGGVGDDVEVGWGGMEGREAGWGRAEMDSVGVDVVVLWGE